MKKGTEKTRKNTFYKTNPRGGISLIVLVITIIVVIILAAAVIISLQNNNPMVEANKARINSDVANMQAIFTNTVGKIMAEKQDVVTIVGGQLYTTPTGNKKTEGEATYQILGTDGTVVVEGKIKFSTEKSEGTTYCTGKELPLYGSDTKWYVDDQGLLLVEVGGILYGEGEKVELKEEIEIAESTNPMIKSKSIINMIDSTYKEKITKIRFVTTDKVPGNRVEEWDISNAQDKSVMAWIESDAVEGDILTIASKTNIIANPDSSYLFQNFSKVKEIENLELLDTSRVTNMQSMFNSCSSLENLDVSTFNTSNVTSMSAMFINCESLKVLNLGGFNTSKVTLMNQLFQNCYNLKTLTLGNKFDMTNVKNFHFMFINCYNIVTVLNLNMSSSSIQSGMFLDNAATILPAQITLNYTANNEERVDSLVSNKGESNIVKGIKLD